jgi:hypothetical protein
MNKLSASFSIILFCILASGCGIEPWVKPYEKAHLADEVMKLNANPVSSSYMEHVYDAREGARGAGIATGGGCGCN